MIASIHDFTGEITPPHVPDAWNNTPEVFKKIEQPTNLEPLDESEIKDNKILHTPLSAEISAHEKKDNFKVPEEVLAYIRWLVAQKIKDDEAKKRLRLLEWNIDSMDSMEEVNELINKELSSGSIDENEKQNILGFFSHESERPVSPPIETLQAELVAKPKAETVPLGEAPAVSIVEPSAIRGRRLIRQQLLQKGLKTPIVGEEFTPVEKNIFKKVGNMLGGYYGEAGAIRMLFAEDESEVSSEPVSEEIPSAPPVPEVQAQEAVPDTTITPAEEAQDHMFGKKVFPLMFAGKKLLIIWGEKDSSDNDAVKVMFDGTIIAEGRSTEAGAAVVIDPKFKHAMLAVATPEEQALASVVTILEKMKKVA